jgi:prevent-host-death family protein
MRNAWPSAKARVRFSEMIDRARVEGPQIVTRHGKRVAVVVAAEELRRGATPKGSLAEFFASSPLRGSGLRIERSREL